MVRRRMVFRWVLYTFMCYGISGSWWHCRTSAAHGFYVPLLIELKALC